MGVHNVKWFAYLLIVVLLSQLVLSETAEYNNLVDRIEKSKAETIKAVKDSQNATSTAILQTIDDNFGVFDQRFQQFFKDSKRDFGIIVLCAMVGGFVLSQIIRIQIEAGKRKATIRRIFELEEKLGFLVKDATRLTNVVSNLQQMEAKYTGNLKSLTVKKPFFNSKTVTFGLMMFCTGLLVMIGLVYFKVIPIG
jgi:hypothetical protein